MAFSGLVLAGFGPINRQRAAICVGQGPWELPDTTRQLADIFYRKGIHTWVDFWGHDCAHDWPWWYKQVVYFFPWLLGGGQLTGGVRELPGSLAYADSGPLAVKNINIGVIFRQIGHIVDRRVLIYHLVHVAAETVIGGVDAAEGQHAVKQIRSAQVEVGGVSGPQTAPEGDNARPAGQPVLYIPCQDGRFFDFGNFHMTETLSPWIESGQIIVFSVDTIDKETWSDKSGDPHWRARRHERWMDYLTREMAPFILDLASQWSPPGTMRQVSLIPRSSRWPAIRENCPRISSWLPSSRDP